MNKYLVMATIALAQTCFSIGTIILIAGPPPAGDSLFVILTFVITFCLCYGQLYIFDLMTKKSK
jgi:hypothetical protein